MERLTSRDNALIRHIRALGASRAARYEAGEYLLDGYKLYAEAVEQDAPVRAVLVADSADDPPVFLPQARYARVPDALMRSLSPLDTPQGLLFTCAMPDCSLATLSPGRYIVLDRLQDPGNIGAIIRSAGAFALDAVLLTSDCADPFNPKAVRAAMGAHFRVRLARGSVSALAEALRDSGTPIYLAAPDVHARDIREAPLSPSAVVIGREGSGLSAEWRGDMTVRIPMQPSCESLGAAVAASIVMWAGYR